MDLQRCWCRQIWFQDTFSAFIVDTFQKVPLLRTCQNQHMWSVFLFTVCLFVCCCPGGVGRAKPREDLARHRDMILCAHDVSLYLPAQIHVSNTLCHWVQHWALGMRALCYLRCAIVFSCSNPLKYLTRLYNIEIYYSVRKESDEISLFRKGFVAKRVPMVFWYGGCLTSGRAVPMGMFDLLMWNPKSWKSDSWRSTIWLFNIAMENHHFFIGKPSISVGHLYHGYVSHNQRVPSFTDLHCEKWSCWWIQVHSNSPLFLFKCILSSNHKQSIGLPTVAFCPEAWECCCHSP